MDKKLVIVIVLAIFSTSVFSYFYLETFNAPDREQILEDIDEGIQMEIENGNYRCCIDPPCDMCYLGHWIWDDGSCKCDDMIANGEFDSVCPQCKKGIEEGYCKSTNDYQCDIEK